MANKYDVFICYRKSDNDQQASGVIQSIKLALSKKGFRVFSTLDAPQDNVSHQLSLSIIKKTNNFMLFLTTETLGGCTDPNDFIRQEIEAAVRFRCKIIPFTVSENSFSDLFPEFLPSSMEFLTHMQVFSFSMTYFFEDCINKLVKNVLTIDNSNAWVFVSHSNKDFDKIVKVRNKLEALQYKPLLFFLKCLEDDKEIFELIKREIKARDRFILCDSQNSRASEWVQKEIDFIKSLNRPYEIIDLDASDSTINECIERFDRRSSVYIWSTSDEIANQLSKRLISKAFKVGILPSTYLYDYLDFKRGVKVNDFKEINKNAYIVAVINRELSKNETQVLDSCSDWFRGSDGDAFLLYVASESEEERSDLIRMNTEFLKEMHQGNGIHARYITSQTVQNQAELVMQDILKLDNYRNAK